MTYQPELDNEETAIKALFLLYRRAQWGMLEDFGINQKEHQKSLDKANEELPAILGKADVAQLNLLCPFLTDAAANIRSVYTLVSQPNVRRKSA